MRRDSAAQTSRSSRSSRSRRRSRRHDEETATGKWLWISVAGVAVLYLAFLSFNMLKSRIGAAKTAPSPLAVEATAPAPAEDEAPGGDAESAGHDLPAAADLIAGIKKAQRLAEDGRKLVRARQFTQAELKFEEAAQLAPYMFSVLFDWSGILIEQKRWAAARDLLLRALAVSPESIPARLALSQVYAQLRQREDALAMAQWVLEAEPHSEAAHQIAADVYSGMERHDRAIEHWQKLAGLNSANRAAKNNLGAAQLKMGQYTQALKTFENVIRDEPSNSQAHYFMALCFVQKQEPELAVDVLVRASNRFGHQFVAAWTRSSDFDDLRDLPIFKQHFDDALATGGAALDAQP